MLVVHVGAEQFQWYREHTPWHWLKQSDFANRGVNGRSVLLFIVSAGAVGNGSRGRCGRDWRFVSKIDYSYVSTDARKIC